MRSHGDFFTDKPQRLNSSVVSNASRANATTAAAGNIAANFMDATGKTRGLAEQCRYHGFRSVEASPLGSVNFSPRSTVGDSVNSTVIEKEPLSCDGERHRVRRLLQEIMQQKSEASVAKLDECIAKKAAGWEKPSNPLTTCQSTRDVFRYHKGPNREVREAPRPKEDSYEARESCRYHSSASPRPRNFRDSVTRESSVARSNRAGAAGVNSDRSLRLDTPGGQATSLGRARSMTPEYHRRYSTNLAGSSLPGSGVGAPQRQRSARRMAGRDPTPLTTRLDLKQQCRYHQQDSPNILRRGSPNSSFVLTSDNTCGEANTWASREESILATPPARRNSPRGSPNAPELPTSGNVGSLAGTRGRAFLEDHQVSNGGHVNPSRENRSHLATKDAFGGAGRNSRRHADFSPSNKSEISGISVANSDASLRKSWIRPVAGSPNSGRMMSFASDNGSNSCWDGGTLRRHSPGARARP
eukprot:TRINITY_DN61757_c0_g1_i1.p1 TRINITY_DN61757_c0_g1~~TRINITY_DN61757_c0_g1_i1.p1  ORF type:complete len:471 (-),score=45.13 TRINITY_DN61757_c0_g1_i1:327-1739(-)